MFGYNNAPDRLDCSAWFFCSDLTSHINVPCIIYKNLPTAVWKYGLYFSVCCWLPILSALSNILIDFFFPPGIETLLFWSSSSMYCHSTQPTLKPNIFQIKVNLKYLCPFNVDTLTLLHFWQNAIVGSIIKQYCLLQIIKN